MERMFHIVNGERIEFQGEEAVFMRAIWDQIEEEKAARRQHRLRLEKRKVSDQLYRNRKRRANKDLQTKGQLRLFYE